MSYRKEKKYRLTTSDLNKVKNILLAQNMKFLYPSRTINSCYFDSKDFISFHHSEEGVLPRKKIRVRWYNKLNIFNKETKISSIEGRFKYTENLDHIKSLDQLLNINIQDNLYGKLKPKIIVTYTREYFLINKLRVTFDRNISYNNLKLSSNLITRDNECVMEIKAPIDCDDDYIENLIPLTTSRFSKYSRGIEKTNSLFLS